MICLHCRKGIDTSDHTLFVYSSWQAERRETFDSIECDTMKNIIKAICIDKDKWRFFNLFVNNIMIEKENLEREKERERQEIVNRSRSRSSRSRSRSRSSNRRGRLTRQRSDSDIEEYETEEDETEEANIAADVVEDRDDNAVIDINEDSFNL